uniref:Uncharacterized protein n=1 Tax=Arundo donax TaxID=35708 RepID=A0A0A9A8W5_ARUDO
MKHENVSSSLKSSFLHSWFSKKDIGGMLSFPNLSRTKLLPRSQSGFSSTPSTGMPRTE